MTGAQSHAPFVWSQHRRLLGYTALAVVFFIALGVWQLNRRVWKHELIERVQSRVHATAVEAPKAVDWPKINGKDYEYTHVSVHGRFMQVPITYVQTTTLLGQGMWAMLPFQTDQGFIVLINRGFIPSALFGTTNVDEQPYGQITVTGYLRITEPKGRFLRRNDPAHEKWYSRDVAAIGESYKRDNIAPYFIDEENDPHSWPRNMTVLQFPDHHLVYALTWFALAVMLPAWVAVYLRHKYRKK